MDPTQSEIDSAGESSSISALASSSVLVPFAFQPQSVWLQSLACLLSAPPVRNRTAHVALTGVETSEGPSRSGGYSASIWQTGPPVLAPKCSFCPRQWDKPL